MLLDVTCSVLTFGHLATETILAGWGLPLPSLRWERKGENYLEGRGVLLISFSSSKGLAHCLLPMQSSYFVPLYFCILAFARYASRMALNDHSPPFVSFSVARSSTLISLPILMRLAGMVSFGAHGKITRSDVGDQTNIWLAVFRLASGQSRLDINATAQAWAEVVDEKTNGWKKKSCEKAGIPKT